MGLDITMSMGDIPIEFHSKKYPDHVFKIGYFRAAYNSDGFNAVISRTLGHAGLYWIFDRTTDSSDRFIPDWELALTRARALLAGFNNSTETRELNDPDWYRQAIEIVIETCEWALNRPAEDRRNLVLHWSA